MMTEELKEGEKLISFRKNIVTVVKVEKEFFYVLTEKGEGYKCPFSFLGKRLIHLKDWMPLKDTTEKPATAEKSCDNCMSMRSGDCVGTVSKFCDFYRPAPTISKEEMDRWPSTSWSIFMGYSF